MAEKAKLKVTAAAEAILEAGLARLARVSAPNDEVVQKIVGQVIGDASTIGSLKSALAEDLTAAASSGSKK